MDQSWWIGLESAPDVTGTPGQACGVAVATAVVAASGNVLVVRRMCHLEFLLFLWARLGGHSVL